MKICIVVFLVTLLQLCLCQECASPCNISLSTCNIVDYLVYPVGLNVSANEIEAAGIIDGVRAYGTLVTQECQDAVFLYTCGVLYPKCTSDSNAEGEIEIIEQKPCISMCLQVQEECSAYLSFLSPEEQAFINCEQLDSDGTPKFSNSSDCYSLENLVPGCGSSNDTGPVARAGCQYYDPTLSPLTQQSCAPFVSSEIFVPNVMDTNIQSLLDSIANKSGVYLVDTLRMVIPIGCYKYMMSLLCQTAFPTCERILDETTGTFVEAGATPCYEMCEEVLDECVNFFSLGGPDVELNCSSLGPNGTPQWPRGPNYIYTPDIASDDESQTTFVVVPCSFSLFPPNATSSQFVMPDVDECPAFLTKTLGRKDEDRLCWVSCPDPSYTPEEWDGLVVVNLITASISIILMAFMLASYLLIAEYRAHQMHMCVFFSSSLMSLSFLMGGRHPQRHVWCVDQTTYSSTRNNVTCDVQGFLLQFGALAVAWWWLALAYHLFQKIVLQNRNSMKKAQRYYHLVAWGVPFLISLVTSAIHAHGFGPPVPSCYIQSPGYQGLNSVATAVSKVPLDYFVFVVPLGLPLMIATYLMTRVAYKVWKVLRESSTIREQTKQDIVVQTRLMFFVIFLLGVLLVLFSWRFYLQKSNGERMVADDLAFIVCRMKNDLGLGVYDSGCEGDELPRRFSYRATMFESIICSGMGIFVFLALGADATIYRFWHRLLLLDPKQIPKFVNDGTTKSSCEIPGSVPSIQLRESKTLNKSDASGFM